MIKLKILQVKAFLTRCADESTLKSSLRHEIGFQKCLHPVDARERHDLYRMNYMTSQQLAANLIVLLDRDIRYMFFYKHQIKLI